MLPVDHSTATVFGLLSQRQTGKLHAGDATKAAAKIVITGYWMISSSMRTHLDHPVPCML
jgi:hypothetical protein